VAGSCEHGNEPSGFIKCWEFLEWVSNCWLLKKKLVGYYISLKVFQVLPFRCIKKISPVGLYRPFLCVCESVSVRVSVTVSDRERESCVWRRSVKYLIPEL
jgi:hypothetical protein